MDRLIDEFFIINRKIRLHTGKSLESPNFDITRDPKCLWGSWNDSERLLTISRRLLNHYPWEAVIETLKHEMAHMIVDEIFELKGAPSHGPDFARACEILGIDPSASHSHIDKMNISNNEKQILCLKMGHSAIQSSKYRKILEE